MELNTHQNFLVYYIMERLRQRRKVIYQQILNYHRQVLQNSYIGKGALKYIATLQCDLPEVFFRINVPRIRSIHRRERTNNSMFLLQQTGNENFYYDTFRMSKESFNLLCVKLSRYLPRPESFVTAPLPIQKQVALCLYKMASGAEYRVVGDMFGLHKTTVHKYLHRVVKAILRLRKEYLFFPKLEEAKAIASEFQEITDIPNIIGAINATHIPIMRSIDGSSEDYINSEGWSSIVMQAVVDSKYIFRDVSIKCPGATNHATVFSESGIYEYSKDILPHYYTDVNGMQTPFMLIGSSAYPLLPWLMKPYIGQLEPQQEAFNCCISAGLKFPEKAFGRLKGRWRCLLKRMDVDPEFVPFVALACTILHNFVETEKQVFKDSWHIKMENEVEFTQPEAAVCNEIIFEDNTDPVYIRDNIKDFLKQNDSLLQSQL